MRLLDLGRGEAAPTFSYSISEDANPLDISLAQGGVPSATVSIEDFGQLKKLSPVQVLHDNDLGSFAGEIRSATRANENIEITMDGAAYILNVDKNALPQRTTLQTALNYYVNTLMGQNAYTIMWHPAVSTATRNQPVSFPGWTGNVWQHMKEMFAVMGLNVTIYSAAETPVIYITPLRYYEIVEEDRTVDSLTITNEMAAEKIEVAYYVMQQGTHIEVWPGNDEDAMTVSVNANEAQTYRIELQGSVSSVHQPTVVDWVPNEPADGTTGRYAVAGSDGLPISAKQWRGQGGSLTVKMVDSTTLEVTVVGMDNKDLSPFNIVMSAGGSSTYNALRITGNGMRWERKTIEYYTGAKPTTATAEVGATIDSVYISSTSETTALQRAANAAIHALGTFNGITNTISGEIKSSPGYGLLVGSRLYADNSYYRLDTATTTPEGTDFSASGDTIVSDFDAVWQGKTIAQYDAHWAGRTMREQLLETLDAI